jgi:hypothetical protein
LLTVGADVQYYTLLWKTRISLYPFLNSCLPPSGFRQVIQMTSVFTKLLIKPFWACRYKSCLKFWCLLFLCVEAPWSGRISRTATSCLVTEVTIRVCTTSFNIKNVYTVRMWSVWISEQTAIISLYSINVLIFITEKECAYCAVRTGSSNKKRWRGLFKGLRRIYGKLSKGNTGKRIVLSINNELRTDFIFRTLKFCRYFITSVLNFALCAFVRNYQRFRGSVLLYWYKVRTTSISEGFGIHIPNYTSSHKRGNHVV